MIFYQILSTHSSRNYIEISLENCMWILGLKGLSPNIHIQILQTDFRTFSSIIVTFRFKDENDYEYEILFKVFSRIIKK